MVAVRFGSLRRPRSVTLLVAFFSEAERSALSAVSKREDMNWQTTVLVTPTLFAVVIALFLGGYALIKIKDGHREPIVVLFFWITVATTVWTGFSALKLLHTDPETKLLFYRVLHIGAATLPPLLFFFVIAYTDRTQWLRPASVGGVFLFPVVFILALFFAPTNIVIDETELITNGLVVLRVSDGPGFLVFLAYSTVLVVGALVLFLLETRRVGATYYPQAALLGIAVLTPITFGVFTTAGVPPFTDERVNLVPTAAAVSTTALGLLLLRYRLFDVPPLAYATAMKYSPDGLCVLDRDKRIVHANEHGHELLAELDIDSDEVLTDRLEDFDPDTASGALLEIQTGDGEVIFQRLLVEPLTRGGRHIGWVVVFRDETAQQRQQQKLQRQNDQLDMFATTVSHDLRNPLSVAEGYLEVARMEDDDDALDEVENAHTRMEEIIERLLVFAHEREQIADRESIVLSEVAVRAWEAVETASAELSIEEDCSVVADPSMLQHVFENLLRNAVEHGGGDVHITVGRLEDGFFIEDDGPGIPEEDAEVVFTPGYSTSTGGTGFGLQIVQTIANAHGWDVAIIDGADGGARFELTGVDLEC